MTREGIDVILARSGVNFTYLAGFEYSGTLARHLDMTDSPRGVVVIWPREGEPALVVNRIASERAQRDSAIIAMHQIDDYGQPYEVGLARVMKDLGLDSARVGAEAEFLSHASWERLKEALTQAQLVDISELMHRVRWIKTPAEVDMIREGARLLDTAYARVFFGIRPGDTEREVHARIVGECLAQGATWTHGILNSSRNRVLYGGESDFALAAGDIVRNDYVSWLNGYPGHQSRPLAIGRPTPEQQRIYTSVRDIFMSTVEYARPGVLASDVYRFAAQAFTDAGHPGRVPLAGHGVGAWWHQQPPFLVPSSTDRLEEGMVIAFEPHVDEFHLQDMFLIRHGGNELLSGFMDTSQLMSTGGV